MRFGVMLASATIAFSALLSTAFAATTPTRTWVSSAGTDQGQCTLAAPCRTFEYAYQQTMAGGEVDVLNSGTYGTLQIKRAISIVAPDGVVAAIDVPANGNGITIDVGAADTVTVRGLTIKGQNQTGIGILIANKYPESPISSGVISDCIIKNLEYGIDANTTGFVLAEHNFITGNSTGISSGSRLFYMGKNTITRNSFGIEFVVNSYGDNILNGNTQADLAFNATVTEVPHDQ